MAKQKYWDGTKWVQVAPSMEEFTTHKADDTSHVKYGIATAANAKIVTLNPAPTVLVEGFALSFKNVTVNTGASTLNINGLGAKPIVKSNGSAVSSGNLKAGSIYTVRYDGASFILQGEGGSGNLQPNQALAGFTFTNDEGEQTGIGDRNLIASNIKSGVSIFGVPGSIKLVAPGEELLHMHEDRSTVLETMNKITESKVYLDGTYRVKFSIRPSNTGAEAYGRIYVNGVTRGIMRMNDNYGSAPLFSEDITLKSGDLLQIYGRITWNLRAAHITQFGVYATERLFKQNN